MTYLFEPAIRLMNRLKYVYKFAVIGLLIVLQAAVLIYMLVSELNKNIDFAVRERVGVQYVQALTNVLNEAQAYRSLHYDYSRGNNSRREEVLSQQAKVDAALATAVEIDKQAAGQMDITWKLEMLQKDWVAQKQAALQFDVGRAQVAFDLDSRWLGEVIDLMQHVGYESKLAMDSDADTSYLADSVLRKMPGLEDNLNTAQGLALQLQDESLSPDNRNRLLQVVGQVRSSLEQVDRNAQLVFRHNDMIITKLKTLHTNLVDSIPIFAWNVEQKTIRQQGGLPIPQELLTAAGNQAIQNTIVMHTEELKVIDQLLVIRIGQYLQYRNIIVFFTGGILLLVSYLFLGFDMSVRRAVYQLDNVMACAGTGDLNVRGTIYSRDEMGSLTNAINNTLDSLQTMYEEVQLSHSRMEAWNQELEQKVEERTASLKNLLDHAGQGFLSFGEDLSVRGEYSAECVAIFNRAITGVAVPALIYPEDRDQQVFLEAVFKKILSEENELLRETYLSLLPEEIMIDSSYIGVAYKLIDSITTPAQRKIMLVLTDLTVQKTMEDQVQAERDILAMVVYVVTHSADFFAAVDQYINFCQEGMPNLLHEEKPAGDILAALFRTVHTFKGTFGQLRLGCVMAKLHEMEGLLEHIRSNEIADLDHRQLANKLSALTPAVMTAWLDEDLKILKEKLGEDFFQQENMLVIDNARLLEIEEKVQRMLPVAECSLLLPDLRRLRYKPIKELLQSYSGYVVALAERNEKAVYPFDIVEGDTLVDPLRYDDFIKSLGHVFRNSIVHGLESFEERVETGKAEIGRITCAAIENQPGITIIISDDGRGMDPAHILDIAVKKGICSPESIKNMQEKEIIQLIFADGFSGAENVNELAGRGVGLSAVRAELEKLGGSAIINTTLGKGTEFQFILPFTQPEKCEPYSILQLAKPLVSAAENILNNEVGLQLNTCTYSEGRVGGKLKLRKVTTFLDIKGIATGRMVLSADQEVVEQLVNNRFGQADIESTHDKKLENILSQYANQIFQHAIKTLPNREASFTAEALVSILAEAASAKYPQAETPTWVLDTGVGKITLSLIYKTMLSKTINNKGEINGGTNYDC
ncbi:MAG: Histidine kinase, gyrase and HSP90-like ATPase [Firmicutes bacterium]|nr:Histidine kinase, gyrase and HSP90-like ATPase [Bacillota bacterium]